MKKISAFLILAVSMIVLSLSVSAASKEDFLYAVKEDGTAIITEFVGYEEILVIPSEIDGYAVSEIGAYCFEYESALRTVEIPASVQIISEKAFSSCYGLETVTLSEGLKEIGSFAFSDCSYLSEIIIPNSVTKLGEGVFMNCSNLNKAVIGNGVTDISNYTFSDCYVLHEVEMGNNVRVIGQSAFKDTGISTIYIPVSVSNIHANAFDDTNIMNVYYGGTEAQWDNIDVSYGNSDLTSVKVRYLVNSDGEMDKTAVKKAFGVIIVYAALVVVLIVAVIIILVKTRKKGVCPYCNTPIEGESKFCGNCGSKL